MAYTDFTLESVEADLGVVCRPGVVFTDLQPVAVPGWLTDMLMRGMQLALVSEKARSEFIVAPLLLAVRDATGGTVAILSGQQLDVDASRQLLGECDFLLARSEPVPRLRAPLMAVVVAKKNDIDGGLGQCIAQMVAAQMDNERAGQSIDTIYGCVTTGEVWQFLKLVDQRVTLHSTRLYVDNVGLLLAAFGAAVGNQIVGRSG